LKENEYLRFACSNVVTFNSENKYSQGKKAETEIYQKKMGHKRSETKIPVNGSHNSYMSNNNENKNENFANGRENKVLIFNKH
jgi:hypothetical protein